MLVALCSFDPQLLSDVRWSDYDVSGTGAQKVSGQKPTHIGRVVEETQVSYQTMAWTALSVAAVGLGVALQQERTRRLLFR